MSKPKKQRPEDEAVKEQQAGQEAGQAEEAEAGAGPQQPEAVTLTREQMEKMEGLEKNLAAQNDKYLRLAAEYDNYRKRTAKEKESAWLDSKLQTVADFLPVYDNLERALKQETCDEAYAKGVDMIMKGFQDVLAKLDVELIPALGETFDPNRHNAVMHVDDPEAGENTVVEVFQQGFLCGEKVIRFAMVKVAN